jgi:pimeloyl-ACP methyl ester carboxylesterase
VLPQDLYQSADTQAVRHTAEIDGNLCVYYEYPSIGDSNKTLVMIHGYRGNHRGLQAIAAGLTKYRVLIPDLPGFGESEPLKTTHSIQAYSDWLHKFLGVLQLTDKAHLMGHSFGSLVVGFYSTQHTPISVSLVNPVSSPALEGQRAALTNLTKLYYSLASALPNALGQWLLRSKLAVMVMSVVMAKSKQRTLRRWIHSQHLSNFSDFATVAVATEGYEASISMDLSKLAGLISSPVLVVAATLDDITDIESQRRVSELYPNSTYREIQGVGHLVHYEAPDQAARFITEFLDNQP